MSALSTSKFWDDEHISKGMLEAHINPNCDGATRRYDFVVKSVDWIFSIANAQSHPKLLDLGCGPGIYAKLFDSKGYKVTGIDFSKRSIEYAKQSALNEMMKIDYFYQNYLDMEYENEFYIITLIYCDYGVLAESDRELLLSKIFKALKKDGIFIMDAFTPNQYSDFSENRQTTYEVSGYWHPNQYACIYSTYRYDECNSFLEQYIVVTEQDCNCYNIWNHAVTNEELEKILLDVGFSGVSLYNNVAGDKLLAGNKVVCSVAKK